MATDFRPNEKSSLQPIKPNLLAPPTLFFQLSWSKHGTYPEMFPCGRYLIVSTPGFFGFYEKARSNIYIYSYIYREREREKHGEMNFLSRTNIEIGHFYDGQSLPKGLLVEYWPTIHLRKWGLETENNRINQLPVDGRTFLWTARPFQWFLNHRYP